MPRLDVVERFWTRVDKTDSCWLWTGNMHWRGYAKFKVGRVQLPAHRWAYEHFVGCAHGHEFNEENTSFRTKGRMQRVCLVCKRARYAKQRRAAC